MPRSTEDSCSELALALDEPREDDETIQYDGTTVMVLTTGLNEMLTTLTLYVEDCPDGSALTLRG